MCPACLLRLALGPDTTEDAHDSEPEPVRLLGPVGSGPHGTVYLAYRPDDDPSFVTVKLINAGIDNPIDAERFRLHTSSADVHPALSVSPPEMTACIYLQYIVDAAFARNAFDNFS